MADRDAIPPTARSSATNVFYATVFVSITRCITVVNRDHYSRGRKQTTKMFYQGRVMIIACNVAFRQSDVS